MLHLAVARSSFRRYSTYVGATVAGVFTNSVFGVIYSFAYLALWAARPTQAATTSSTPSPTSGSARHCS